MKIRTALCLAALARTTAQAASEGVTGIRGPALAGKELTAEPALTGPEVSIPFINHGGIRDFHAYNDLGIWIQGSDRKWYYGKFFAPCIGITTAFRVGFRGGPTDALDRFSKVVSRETGTCTLTSLRAGELPPGLEPKKDEKKDQKDDAKP